MNCTCLIGLVVLVVVFGSWLTKSPARERRKIILLIVAPIVLIVLWNVFN